MSFILQNSKKSGESRQNLETLTKNVTWESRSMRTSGRIAIRVAIKRNGKRKLAKSATL
jgi:hypothetical protein